MNAPGLLARLLELRLGTTIGMALFAVSLLFYRSYSHAILGVWSAGFFALVVAAWLGLAFWIVHSLRRRDRDTTRPALARTAAACFDLAVLLLGTAYLVSTLDSRGNAARITNLDLFGSIAPLPSLLEWLAAGLALLAALLALLPRAGARGGNTLIAVGATLAALLAAEGGLRVYFALAPMTTGIPTHSHKLWLRRHVTVNSEGLRDSQHTQAATASERRLLVVGDSFAYGIGIRRPEDRFGEQIAARLTEASGTRWESLNASVPGSSTNTHVKLLGKILPYRPDVVLLLYVFNDMDYLHPVTPDLKAERLSATGVLYSNSQLFQLAYMLYHFRLHASRGDEVAAYTDDGLVTRHLADVKRFVTLARVGGASVFVVPMDLTVIPAKGPRPGHINFLRLAGQADIPVISALNVFEGQEYKDLIVSPYDHHPNEVAYRIAAARVADELKRRLGEPTRQ